METEVDACLLEAWRASAGDVDQQATGWLRAGSPAGIDKQYDVCGVFPFTDKLPDLRDLVYHTPEFSNDLTVEEDPVATGEIDKLIATGYVRAYDSIEAVRAVLGCGPSCPSSR